jgi:hypothetical protein
LTPLVTYILKWLRDHGSGMVDHAPAAMKLVRLAVKHAYDCDAHGLDLVYAKMSESLVGTQDGLGSLRIFQFFAVIRANYGII